VALSRHRRSARAGTALGRDMTWERVVQQGGIETIVSYPPSIEKGWLRARVGDVASITKVYSLERTKERILLIRLSLK